MHANARLILLGRRLLIARIQQGRPVAHVADELGISRQTAYRSGEVLRVDLLDPLAVVPREVVAVGLVDQQARRVRRGGTWRSVPHPAGTSARGSCSPRGRRRLRDTSPPLGGARRTPGRAVRRDPRLVRARSGDPCTGGPARARPVRATGGARRRGGRSHPARSSGRSLPATAPSAPRRRAGGCRTRHPAGRCGSRRRVRRRGRVARWSRNRSATARSCTATTR